MSNAPQNSHQDGEREEPRGPSLVVMYLVVALALAAAIGFALMIVFPFWSRSH